MSYGDLLTLLFAVFVTLYSMSQADKKKAEEVSASIQKSFGMIESKAGSSPRPSVIDVGKTGVVAELKFSQPMSISQTQQTKPLRIKAGENDFRAIKTTLDAFLLKTGNQGSVGVQYTRRGLVISLREAGFFDSGSAVIMKDSSNVIGAIADLLNQYSNRFRVEGHTDNVAIQSGPFTSNWDLSTARATWLVKRLIRYHDIDPLRVSAVGYAEYQPVADNGSAEGRAQNRRIDVVLLSSDTEYAEAQPASAGASDLSQPPAAE